MTRRKHTAKLMPEGYGRDPMTQGTAAQRERLLKRTEDTLRVAGKHDPRMVAWLKSKGAKT